MRHLRLVPNQLHDNGLHGPYEVTITNPRFAGVIYMEIWSFHFAVSGEYPHGLLTLIQDGGTEVIHECLPGDRIESPNGVAVEAV